MRITDIKDQELQLSQLNGSTKTYTIVHPSFQRIISSQETNLVEQAAVFEKPPLT